MMEPVSIAILLIVYLVIVWLFENSPGKPLNPEPLPLPEPGEVTIRNFSWEKPGISKSYKLRTGVEVRIDAYQMARKELFETTPSKMFMKSDDEYFDVGLQEVLHPDFGAFNFEIMQIAKYLSDMANTELLSDYEFAGLILSFTQEQCIRYQFDKDSTGYNEYMRLPLETIFDTVGDCDCKAILACALFKTLGYRVALALMPGHAALAITLAHDDLPFANFVMDGKRWFYCETTGDYWNPGVLPDGINPYLVILKEI